MVLLPHFKITSPNRLINFHCSELILGCMSNNVYFWTVEKLPPMENTHK